MTGNKYEVTLDETWELFGQFISGARAGDFCIVSATALSDTARSALESSAKALGYGAEACTYVVTRELEGNALFALIEGLDPFHLIATDESSSNMLGEAYRKEVAVGGDTRLFGRTCIAFPDFEVMLETPEKKQVAWALLKKIEKAPRR